jgi:predicted O-methyltransferase YrrM
MNRLTQSFNNTLTLLNSFLSDKRHSIDIAENLDLKLLLELYKKIPSILIKSEIRHLQASMIASIDKPTLTSSLLNYALSSVIKAAATPINVRQPSLPDSKFFNIFPGEHYRLISAFVEVAAAKYVVEIGTSTGMSAVSMLQANPQKLITFDLTPWNLFPSHLESNDFTSGRVMQVIADLYDDSTWNKNHQFFDQADLIFMDGPKDGRFEAKVLDRLGATLARPGKWLVLDDIRLPEMIDVWERIWSPKLDLTSFGHWSGTGLVSLEAGLDFR